MPIIITIANTGNVKTLYKMDNNCLKLIGFINLWNLCTEEELEDQGP